MHLSFNKKIKCYSKKASISFSVKEKGIQGILCFMSYYFLFYKKQKKRCFFVCSCIKENYKEKDFEGGTEYSNRGGGIVVNLKKELKELRNNSDNDTSSNNRLTGGLLDTR